MPKIKPVHQQGSELDVNSSQSEVEAEKSENIISEKQDNDNELYSEKNVGASSPDIILSENSEISQITHNDETANGSTVSVENENGGTSNVSFDRTSNHEEYSIPTPPVIMDDGRLIVPEDENRPTSSVYLTNCKTIDVDDSSTNQLVPDAMCNKDGNEDDKLVDEDQVVDGNNNKISEEDEERMIAKQMSNGVLTDSMLDQEKKLHQEHLKEEKEMVTKVHLSTKKTTF
jgi:hypothetical protein